MFYSKHVQTTNDLMNGSQKDLDINTNFFLKKLLCLKLVQMLRRLSLRLVGTEYRLIFFFFNFLPKFIVKFLQNASQIRMKGEMHIQNEYEQIILFPKSMVNPLKRFWCQFKRFWHQHGGKFQMKYG